MPELEPDGFVYGPNASGKKYKSLNYHRNMPRPGKTRWADVFTRDHEYELFDTCDRNNWRCADGHYWGTLNGKFQLGMTEERFSFCPVNTNPRVPWHGYPVRGSGKDYQIPESILEAWLEDGIITDIIAKRIRSAKI